MAHGSIQQVVKGDGRYHCVVWTGNMELDSGETRIGFLMVNGGICTDLVKARIFNGVGEAIRWAQIYGIAITDGVIP